MSYREPKYPIIAFCGPATAGKTTAAKLVLGDLLLGQRLSFADPIRDMMRAIGVDDHYMSVNKTEPIPWLGGKSAREIMQTLGTQWGRGMVCQDIWLNVADRKIAKVLAGGFVPVIDDVRFDNEAELIHSYGGFIIEIRRPNRAYSTSHESERGVANSLIDATVYNQADTTALGECLAELIFHPQTV